MSEAPPQSKTISIGTDVATFMVFHPDDLPGRGDWPIAWWSAGFAYAPLAAAGHLLAFGTGSDGGYVVRLAHRPGGADPLSPAERSMLVMSFDARCEVRHGGVYLTNDDALPGEESRADGELTPDRFLPLPNGFYRVTVHDLDLSAIRATRPLTGDDADFVIGFEPVDRAAFDAIRPANEPPRIRPAGMAGSPGNADRIYGSASLTEHQRAFLLGAQEDFGSRKPAKAVQGGGSFVRFPVAGALVLPGESRDFDVAEPWFDAFQPEDPGSTFVVMAPSPEAGSLAMVGWIHGSGEYPERDGHPSRLFVSVRGCFPVRTPWPNVAGRIGRWLGLGSGPPPGEAGDMARIDLPPGTMPVPRRDEEPVELDIADLKTRILALIDRDTASPVLGLRPGSPSHERAAVAAADDPAALLDWLLRHLDIPATERLALWPESVADRADVLVAKLRSLA